MRAHKNQARVNKRTHYAAQFDAHLRALELAEAYGWIDFADGMPLGDTAEIKHARACWHSLQALRIRRRTAYRGQYGRKNFLRRVKREREWRQRNRDACRQALAACFQTPGPAFDRDLV